MKRLFQNVVQTYREVWRETADREPTLLVGYLALHFVASMAIVMIFCLMVRITFIAITHFSEASVLAIPFDGLCIIGMTMFLVGIKKSRELILH